MACGFQTFSFTHSKLLYSIFLAFSRLFSQFFSKKVHFSRFACGAGKVIPFFTKKLKNSPSFSLFRALTANPPFFIMDVAVTEAAPAPHVPLQVIWCTVTSAGGILHVSH
ncbi:MAG: hypothetical protein LKJ86_00565 [Oscillibacter sp.]|nr:hypothetical protein [Oscillibacter sp.]